MGTFALQTRGVNVRPRKPTRTGAPPPRFLRAGGTPDPDRATVSRRRRGSGQSMPRVRDGRKRSVAVRDTVPLPQKIASVQAQYEESVAEVRRLKAFGEPYRHAAHNCRMIRARLLELTGEVGKDITVEIVNATGAVGSATGERD